MRILRTPLFFFFVSVALASLLFAVSESADVPEADRSGRVISSLRDSLPRTTFAGGEAPRDFRLGDSSYREALVIIGLPAVCLGGLVLLCGVCFCTSRLCCDGCGGNLPDPPYSLKWRMCMMVALVLMGLLVVACAVVGFAGTFSANAIASRTFAGVSLANEAQRNASESVARAGVESAAGRPEEAYAAFLDTARSVYASSRTNVSDVRSYEGYRHFLIISALVISSLGALAAIVAPPCQSTAAAKLVYFAGLVGLPLLWISFGVLLPFSIALEDFCVSVAALVNTYSPDPNVTVPVVPGDLFFASCLPMASVVSAFNLTLVDLDAAASVLESNIAVVQRELPSANLTSFRFAFDPVLPYREQFAWIEGNASGLAARLDVPPLSDAGNEKNRLALENGVGDMAAFGESLASLEKLGRCGFAIDAYTGLREDACDGGADPSSSDTANGPFDNLLGAVFFTGVLWMPMTIIGILGSKRFDKVSRVGPAPEDEKDDAAAGEGNNNKANPGGARAPEQPGAATGKPVTPVVPGNQPSNNANGSSNNKSNGPRAGAALAVAPLPAMTRGKGTGKGKGARGEKSKRGAANDDASYSYSYSDDDNSASAVGKGKGKGKGKGTTGNTGNNASAGANGKTAAAAGGAGLMAAKKGGPAAARASNNNASSASNNKPANLSTATKGGGAAGPSNGGGVELTTPPPKSPKPASSGLPGKSAGLPGKKPGATESPKPAAGAPKAAGVAKPAGAKPTTAVAGPPSAKPSTNPPAPAAGGAANKDGKGKDADEKPKINVTLTQAQAAMLI